jgi:uncharacterized protein (DUF58 family)
MPAERSEAETVLTPRGKTLLAVLWSSGAMALLLRQHLLFLLAALLLGAALSSWLLARRNLRRARVVREAPARARAGRRTPVAWRVEASGGDAVGVLVRDGLDGASRPGVVEAAFAVVPAGRSREATAWTTFERRGLRRLRAPTVSTSFPLGVFSLSRAGAESALVVRPREGTPTPALLARLRGDEGSSSALEMRRAALDRFHALREFREGDDPRRIHWRTTARRGVRTFAEWRSEAGRRVVVVLGRGVRGRDSERRFERAVSAAATVVSACARERLPVRLLLGRPPREGTRGAPERGVRGVEAALDALALVRVGEARDPAQDVASVGAGAPRTVVWISAGPEPGVDAAARAAAGRGGIVLHLRVDEPGIERFVRGLP